MSRECEEILQAIGHPILILDPQHRILAANWAALKVRGMREADILGNKCYEIFHNGSNPPTGCPLEKMLMSRQLETFEMEMEAFGGTFLVSCTPFFNAQGHLEKIFHIATDVTKLKHVREGLRESEERYRALVEDMPAMICRFLPDGILTFVNSMYAKFFGKNPEELIGHNFFQFIPEEEHEGVRNHLRSLGRDKPMATYEHQVIAPDGTVHWMQWTDRVLFDKEGNVGECQSLGIDTTARKQAEEELARHRDHLEELVRERTYALEGAQEELLKRERLSVLGQITATVSHELRNPLGVIGSSVFYLRQRCNVVDEKVLKHLERIEEQVSLCDSIVADLLEYTRGRHSEKIVGDLSALTRRILEENPPPPGVNIDRDFSDEPLLVPFDPLKLSRVMVNLLENAYQAVIARTKILKKRDNTYLASVRICIMRGDGEAVIEVEDNGIGMDEETARRACEPLFTRKARGIGLGLSIVQKVIKEHGGRLFLTSRPNLGTKVTLVLPADYGGHIV